MLILPFRVPQKEMADIESHHLLLGGFTLYILTIQLDVVNASSKCSSLISLFPISTPLARSYLSFGKASKRGKLTTPPPWMQSTYVCYMDFVTQVLVQNLSFSCVKDLTTSEGVCASCSSDNLILDLCKLQIS